jgi:zinc transport system substrate-binding protein
MRRAVIVAIVLASLSSACLKEVGDPGTLRVVAAFYPLAETAIRVSEDRAIVDNLTPPGAEPHDIELGPDDVGNIQGAYVILYIGGGFQPALEEAVAQAPQAEALDLLASTGGGDDPHIWLDPVRMQAVVRKIAEIFRAFGPRYGRGADAYADEIAAIDRAYAQGLRSCRSRILVTSHDAFGRLAGRYDLEAHPITGLSPEAEPDPKRLAELRDLVRREGVTTIFTETLVSPAVADTLARETGARTAILDPIEGLTDAQIAAGETYETVMLRNLRALRDGLGCR